MAEKIVTMAGLCTLPASSFWSAKGVCENDIHFPTVKCRKGLQITSASLAAKECKVLRRTESNFIPLSAPLVIREPHKYFDHAIIVVRSGDGGNGAVLSLNSKPAKSNSGKPEKERNKKKSYKRDFDGSLILPVGGCGGNVVVYAEESIDTLLELHSKKRFNGKRGGNVDSAGILSSNLRDGLDGSVLRIPVPVGTVVKRKRGGLLADLAKPGDEVLVARGGQGGISLLDGPERRKKQMMSLTSNVMRDESDKVLVHGQLGEEISIELILRIVADVGLVGLPNAGKSTLLAAITRANPEIADYPFTTLMPNLGRLDGDPSLSAHMFTSEATLADLPGLIEGAHLGKGLGRSFLRHLRRTQLLLHVVDASAKDPVNDFRTVKEELRMYNPNYLERPHIVVLNKIDLPNARDRLSSLISEISIIGCEEYPSQPDTSKASDSRGTPIIYKNDKERQLEDYPRPLAVVGVSVLKGIMINEMLEVIRNGLRKCRNVNSRS